MKKNVISVVLLLGLWQILAMIVNKSILVPFPKDVFLVMANQLGTITTYQFIGITFIRILYSFLLALIISILLVLIMRKGGLLKTIINHLLLFLRVVPTAAIILMALVWLNPHQSVVLITLLVMIPLMVDVLNEEFNRIESQYADPLRLYGSSWFDNLKSVLIPLSLPTFLTLCKSAFLLGLKVVISSEVLVSIQSGIGRELQLARFDLNMNRLFASTIWIVLLAILVSTIFNKLIDHYRA